MGFDEGVKRYQVIGLEQTNNLVKGAAKIEEEKEIVQRLMIENNIEFVIEIVEEGNGDEWFLELMVPKEDVDKVIAILDQQGGLGYVLDLDETLLVSKDTVKLVNDVDVPDNYEDYLRQCNDENVREEVDIRTERIMNAFKREEKIQCDTVKDEEIDSSEDAIESNNEFSDGINKPKKTIIDYLIYIIIAIIIIKILGAMS